MLDALDRKILQKVCNGIHSYEQLSKLCNVGRNTIYRRIDKLEKEGIITKKIMAIPSYDKINFSAIIIGINVNAQDVKKTIEYLKNQQKVKFLWRTYGTHDIVFTMVCDNEDVGKCIYNLRLALEKLNVNLTHFDTSTSISWEKINLSPS